MEKIYNAEKTSRRLFFTHCVKLIERKTRYGKIFYGCSGYPTCKFASWEKPTNLRCPKCKKYLTVRETKTNLNYKCSNKDCDFTKQEDKVIENKK